MARQTNTPWLKRRGESLKAYEAAKLYCELRQERSHAAVGQRLGKSTVLMNRWSKKHQWVKRAESYDAWLDREDQKAAEVFAKIAAIKWAQRESDKRERKFIQHEKVLDAADLMLRYPLTESKVTVAVDASGRETQIQVIKPAKWAKRDVVRYLQVGHALGTEAIRNEGATATDIEVNDTLNYVDYESAGKAKKTK